MQYYLDALFVIRWTTHRLVLMFPMALLTSPITVMDRSACPTRQQFTVLTMTCQYLSTATALSARVYKHPYAIARVKMQPVVKERAFAVGLQQIETHFVLELRISHQLLPHKTAYFSGHFACDCSTLLHCQELLCWRVGVKSREGCRVRLRWRECIASRHACHALFCLGVVVSWIDSIIGLLFT